jgi:hypothetical protein
VADIASNLDKINDIEVAQEAPVTESLFNKIGADINGLIDIFDPVVFTSGGTYTVPGQVTEVWVFGCGGGGGGHGGGNEIGGGGASAGGCYARLITVTPGAPITVTIGAGGAGGGSGASGAPGGNTLFGTTVWRGGLQGGVPGAALATQGSAAPGDGGVSNTGGNSQPGAAFGQASGGTGNGGGGAGGGTILGIGGNGGNAASSPTAGGSGAANTGAGGGGGGGDTDFAQLGAAGGSGGSGILVVMPIGVTP